LGKPACCAASEETQIQRWTPNRQLASTWFAPPWTCEADQSSCRSGQVGRTCCLPVGDPTPSPLASIWVQDTAGQVHDRATARSQHCLIRHPLIRTLLGALPKHCRFIPAKYARGADVLRRVLPLVLPLRSLVARSTPLAGGVDSAPFFSLLFWPCYSHLRPRLRRSPTLPSFSVHARRTSQLQTARCPPRKVLRSLLCSASPFLRRLPRRAHTCARPSTGSRWRLR